VRGVAADRAALGLDGDVRETGNKLLVEVGPTVDIRLF